MRSSSVTVSILEAHRVKVSKRFFVVADYRNFRSFLTLYRHKQTRAAVEVRQSDLLVFSLDHGYQQQPNDDHGYVDCGECCDIQEKIGADKNNTGRQDIAKADKKSIDGRLRFVFGFPTCREKQRLPGRVLKRVVGAIFQDLGYPDVA
jgi:hypothetical protein